MPAAFSRSLRALAADSARRSNAMLLTAGAVLLSWGLWFFFTPVGVYETTTHARLEASRSVHRVSAPAVGRVMSTSLELGRSVAAGEVLVELDTEAQRLELDAARARLAALEPELAALQREIDVQQRAAGETLTAGQSELDEARARHRQAADAAAFAETEHARTEGLLKGGAVSEGQLANARAMARERRGAAEALFHHVKRLEVERKQHGSDRLAGIEQRRSVLAERAGEQHTLRAQIARLEHEVERRRIRAPVAGSLGETADLRVGAMVSAGEVLGTVVPSGLLRIVAEFDPRAAIGRIIRGQFARLRLDGFPWTQYGSISATVFSVASEPRDGRIRVELAIGEQQTFSGPLTHGMTGTLEIRVETSAPATLVLRAAGKLANRSEREAK